MSTSSRSSAKQTRTRAVASNVEQVPKHLEFSLKEIRAIIPPELFERSYVKSFYWLCHDLVLIACMYLLAWNYLNHEHVPFFSVRIVLWLVWWYVQGALLTGIWVIAHECGHHSFTPNKLLNNIIGFICQTMLLVPYFSWQYTHAQHHARTNNLEMDTVHCPRMKHATSANNIVKPRNRSAFDRLTRIFKLSVLGWPLYLLLDLTGPPAHDELSWVNHFNPYCAYFPATMAPFVVLSDVGLIAWMYCLYRIAAVMGWMNLLFYYFVPYLIVNHWLVIITFLQHTDWAIDRYTSSEWTWIRGAFGTIDRDYGAFLNYAHHHIQDSHVVHHLFSTMPHYHAIEATRRLKNSPVFAQYYRDSHQSWYGALWEIVGQGRWYKKDENTLQLKNHHY